MEKSVKVFISKMRPRSFLKSSFFVALFFTACLFCLNGCTSSTEKPSDNSVVSQDQVTSRFGMTEDFSFQGVHLKVNPSWKVTLKNDDSLVGIGPADESTDNDSTTTDSITPFTMATIWVGMNGQTVDGETAIEARAIATGNPSNPPSLSNLDQWSDDGISYNLYIDTTPGTSNLIYYITGIDSSNSHGFILSIFKSGEVSDDEWESFLEELKSGLSYNSSETTVDTFSTTSSVLDSDGNNGQSSSGSGSSSASKEYRDGTYKVGTDIPAGEYKLTSTDSLGGYWEVTESSAADADIIGNENFTGSTYVTVEEGQYLKLHNCVAVSVED